MTGMVVRGERSLIMKIRGHKSWEGCPCGVTAPHKMIEKAALNLLAGGRHSMQGS